MHAFETEYLLRHKLFCVKCVLYKGVVWSIRVLTVADYRKRADECLVKADLASDRDGKFQWWVLADLWRISAEQSDRRKFGSNKTPDAAANKTGAIEDGERLRARLDLVN